MITIKKKNTSTIFDSVVQSGQKAAAIQKIEHSEDKLLERLAGLFGSGFTQRMDGLANNSVDVFDLKHITLNEIFGGGLPKGCIVEIFGKEGTGKTTLCLQILASILHSDPSLKSYYINAESVINYKFFRYMLGETASRCYIGQFAEAEKVMDLILELACDKKVNVIVLDSIAGLFTKSSLENSLGDSSIASLARVLSGALSPISKVLADNGVTLILTNQLRNKISTFGAFGNPEQTCGGNAIRFFSSVRLELTRIGMNTKDDEIISAKIRFKAVKQRFALPFQERVLDLNFGKGFEPVSDLVNIAIEQSIIQKNGSWFGFESQNLCQGKENLIILLKENTQLQDKIYELVMSKLCLQK